jgi:hypothetical protein
MRIPQHVRNDVAGLGIYWNSQGMVHAELKKQFLKAELLDYGPGGSDLATPREKAEWWAEHVKNTEFHGMNAYHKNGRVRPTLKNVPGGFRTFPEFWKTAVASFYGVCPQEVCVAFKLDGRTAVRVFARDGGLYECESYRFTLLTKSLYLAAIFMYEECLRELAGVKDGSLTASGVR